MKCSEIPLDCGGVCPKCGSASGYVAKLAVSGIAREVFEWSGEYQERIAGEDSLRYRQPRTVACADCGARFRNPGAFT